MQEKYEIVRDMFRACDYMAIVTGPFSQRIAGTKAAYGFILGLDGGKNRISRP